MKYKRGTNQHRNKPKYRFWGTVQGSLVILFWIGMLATLGQINNEVKIISPLPVEATVSKPADTVVTVSPPPQQSDISPVLTKSAEQEKIEAYIKTIFGNQGRVAIAVSRNECGPTNKTYPGCVYHTPAEYSVGIFQINLYNSSHWIHAKKVPGDTMEQKAEWLKNPYHNTLIAYKIYTDSGFNPWSAYTSNRYLKDM